MSLPKPKHTWNFNEISGRTAADPVGGATIAVDSESFVAGKVGNALRFNPKDGARLATTTLPELPPPWTAAFWVKREADSDGATLFSSSEYALKLEQWENTHEVGFTQFGQGDKAFGYRAPIGEWVHLALVGTAAETRLYVNGRRQATLPSPVKLGLRWLGSSGGYVEVASMILDEVKIFDEALTDAQVPELLNEAAKIEISEGGAPVGPNGVDWGTIPLDGKGTTKTITVANRGDDPLRVERIALEDGTVFSCSPPSLPQELARGASLTFQVTFTPDSTGARSTSVQVFSNAAGSPHTFTVSGRADWQAEGDLEVTESGRLIPSGSDYDFGTVTVGSRAARTFTVTNRGRYAWQLAHMGTSATSAFSMKSDSWPKLLSPGASATFTLACAPTTLAREGIMATFFYGTPGIAIHGDPNAPGHRAFTLRVSVTIR